VAGSNDQVASSLQGSQSALFCTPICDRLMIASEEDVRDGVASKLSWSGVLGKLKHPIASAE
jgi:hypothetical protein